GGAAAAVAGAAPGPGERPGGAEVAADRGAPGRAAAGGGIPPQGPARALGALGACPGRGAARLGAGGPPRAGAGGGAPARGGGGGTPMSAGASMVAVDGRRVPLRSVAFEGTVSGAHARARVRQTFVNEEAKPVEAVYTFPLPSDAVLGAFSMRCAGRAL